MAEGYAVTITSGSLRPDAVTGWEVPHAWTAMGVHVDAELTGAHLLHLSVAACVLNDVHREADGLGYAVAGVRVSARGGFDTTTWTSTGIGYDLEVDTDIPSDHLVTLLARVHEVAEIPRALRAGVPVDHDPLAAS